MTSEDHDGDVQGDRAPEPADAGDLADGLADQDPQVGLHAVWALRSLLEQVERLQVDNARAQGWSWNDIATVLHVSKQSVHEKHSMRRKAMGMET